MFMKENQNISKKLLMSVHEIVEILIDWFLMKYQQVYDINLPIMCKKIFNRANKNIKTLHDHLFNRK